MGVGVGRRRYCYNEAKERIVAESYAPGATVSQVARRHSCGRSSAAASHPASA